MSAGRIRVLHCIETLESGGVERRRLSLVKLLDKERFEIRIICTRISGPFAEQFEKEGIPIIEVGKLTNSFKKEVHRNVRKVIREFKPHIIHGAVFEGVTMAALNGFRCSVPIRIIEETSDPQNRSKKASLFLRLLTMLTHKVVAISPSVRAYLTGQAKIPEHKVYLINNGVDPPRAVSLVEVQQLKTALGISDQDFVIGSAGRIRDNHKAFSDLIKAMDLLRSYDHIKLIIVGEGPDREMLTTMVADMGLSDRVLWPGYQNDMAPYYEVMDVFAIVSNREGFGLVAAEAMLHELPVIATNVGGLGTIVQSGETGFLVNRKSPDQIASNLKKFLEDATLVASMGQKGKLRAQAEFSAEVYVNKVRDLYEDLLKKKRLI